MDDALVWIKGVASAAKDLAAGAKDVLIGGAVLAAVIWLVFGSRPADWSHIKVGKDGVSFDHAVQAAKDSAADTAKNLEQIRNDVISLQTRMTEIGTSFQQYKANPSQQALAKLDFAINGAKAATDNAVSSAASSARETAKSLTRIDDIALKAEEAKGADVATIIPKKGWVYLGKISKDHLTWLPSSASGALTFSPAVQEGADIIKQIKPNETIIESNGYKYLRSTDSSAGARVEAAIARTLRPNTPVKVLELDTKGVDRADGQMVVWALVEVER